MENNVNLVELLSTSCVHFAYRKRSGELRIAYGTTMMSLIPEENHPKGTGTEKVGVKSYWDLNSEGWRSYDPNQVIWVNGKTIQMLTAEEQRLINEYKENQSL